MGFAKESSIGNHESEFTLLSSFPKGHLLDQRSLPFLITLCQELMSLSVSLLILSPKEQSVGL